MTSHLLRTSLLRAFVGVCLLTAVSCESPPVGPTLAVQWYPTGFITKVEMHHEVGEKGLLGYGIGWNEADRSDNGEHFNEQGGGPGLVFGYRHYLGERYEGFFVSGHVDIWQLEIDWVDLVPLRTGSTDVTVVQPYAGAGYRFPLGEGAMLELAAGLGAEINVATSGEDVGEGAIFLAGLSLLF